MATRRLPYGYRFDGTTIVIDDIEGKIVKEIYELFCEGVYITKIKNYIKNFDMSRHKVKRILEDDVYIGINDLPQIIDEDLFETVQKIKNQRLKEIGKNQDKPYSYVKENFENKIVCGECGVDYHRYKRGEEYIWNCNHKVFKRKICCKNISLSDEQIENIWSNVIQKINENPNLLQLQKTISNKNLGRYNALDREIKLAETGKKEYTQEELIKLIYKRAQEESRNISENVRWGLKRKYETGETLVSRLLRYKRNKNGQLEIIPEEAEIVKFIFAEFMEVSSYNKIANKLKEKGYKTIRGKKTGVLPL